MAHDVFSIAGIGSYVPVGRSNNFTIAEKFDYPRSSVVEKIGITATAQKESGETVSDMCVMAWECLGGQVQQPLKDDLDVIVLVTQHPERQGIPHTSALVHSKLGLPVSCFAFDISLGCSGFVAALAIVKGYLASTHGSKAVIFTCDPYSPAVSADDKDTAMIFGDAATATLVTRGDQWAIGAFDMGTSGKHCDALMNDSQGVVRMKGRPVFSFCATHIPESVNRVLRHCEGALGDLDFLVLHPASKYVVDAIRSRLGLPPLETLPSAEYGNTVSSSIPLILRDIPPGAKVIASGFGVGLGWATCSLGMRNGHPGSES